MNCPSPFTPVASTPSPAVTVVEISDPTAVGEQIEVLKQDAVQLKPRRLRARRVIVRLDPCLIVYHSTNMAIRTRTTLQDGLVAFVAFGPRAAGTVNGLSVGPGRILASPAKTEVEFVVSAGYESVSFLLPPDHIRAHLRDRHRAAQFRLPSRAGLLQASVATASQLFDWGRRLTDTAARTPEIFNSPGTRGMAEIELLQTLLAIIGTGVEGEAAHRERTRQTHSRIVRLAEDFAAKHATGRLHVTELCQAAAVSERTLQYAFKQIVGMTPVAYLTRLRLHRVRQAFRAADPRSTTVTAEALKWGFWHLGEFSRAYRSCFGELPSDTLRRK